MAQAVINALWEEMKSVWHRRSISSVSARYFVLGYKKRGERSFGEHLHWRLGVGFFTLNGEAAQHILET